MRNCLLTVNLRVTQLALMRCLAFPLPFPCVFGKFEVGERRSLASYGTLTTGPSGLDTSLLRAKLLLPRKIFTHNTPMNYDN